MGFPCHKTSGAQLEGGAELWIGMERVGSRRTGAGQRWWWWWGTGSEAGLAPPPNIAHQLHLSAAIWGNCQPKSLAVLIMAIYAKIKKNDKQCGNQAII